MADAEQIRSWIVRRIIQPARSDGNEFVDIRAGDVHDRMGLKQRVPSVCSVLARQKLQDEANITLLPPIPNGPRPSNIYRFQIGRRQAEANETSAGPQRTEAAVDIVCQTPNKIHNEKDKNQTQGRISEIHEALVLVSCVKRKKSCSMPAQDLYDSTFFYKTRTISEKAASWRILSAKHGLLDPNMIIDPYEETLTGATAATRRRWADSVLRDLLPLASKYKLIVIFAGEMYREHIVPALENAGIRVEIPLKGLRQGEQLAWLSQIE